MSSRLLVLSTSAVAAALQLRPAVALSSTSASTHLHTKAWVPATVGQAVSTVDTPAFLLDMDAFDANMDALAARLDAARGSARVLARVHAKALKCAPLVQRQLDLLGPDFASGCCAQTVTELEALLVGGVRDVLLTNQVVGPAKIARFARLVAEHAASTSGTDSLKIGVLVDDATNAEELCAALEAAGAPPVGAYVEVDAGQHRCGVEEPEAAADLVEVLEQLKARGKRVFFGGLHAYHGANQHTPWSTRQANFDGSVKTMVERTLKALAARGLPPPPVVTGGGTGSFELEAGSGLYHEIQPGSFVVMDGQYRAAGMGEGDGQSIGFRTALSVLTTVCSRPSPVRAVVDAGAKGIDLVGGLPIPRALDESSDSPISGVVGYRLGGDEHGILDLEAHVEGVRVGDVLELLPAHCDPTVNAHDYFVCHRGGKVVAVYPIAGRGPGL